MAIVMIICLILVLVMYVFKVNNISNITTNDSFCECNNNQDNTNNTTYTNPQHVKVGLMVTETINFVAGDYITAKPHPIIGNINNNKKNCNIFSQFAGSTTISDNNHDFCCSDNILKGDCLFDYHK